MRVAIIGTRWPDVEVERVVMGVDPEDILRDAGDNADAIIASAAGADVILAGPRPRFDAAVIEQLDCKGIVRYGVGYDNVDVAAAVRRGMAVAYVPDYGTEAVALHSLALVLAALRRIPQLDRTVKAGSWGFAEVRPLHLPTALTAGVIGFGRIGRATAHHFQNVGFARVLAHDEFVVSDVPGIESVSLHELLEQADVVSLHAPGVADGSPLLGPAEFGLMRSGGVLVNTARGSLVDTRALISGLRAGRPRLAALDVFEQEPPDPEMFADVGDQVILTPHTAWYTEETERDLRVKTAQEAKRIVAGEAPRHPVPLPEDAR